jgi:hygromycin-B 4-O-kinase
MTNYVFLAEHDKGHYVVRIAHQPEKIDAFRKEQWACEAARKARVPTPEILEVGLELIGQPYMLVHKAEGNEATEHGDRLPVVRELGRLAAVINRIPTSGFGEVFDWAEPDRPRNATWAEFLQNELEMEKRFEILRRNEMITPQQAPGLRIALESLAAKPAHTTLCHGDIRLKNTIVDDEGKVQVLLDWEHCQSTIAPFWELSIALHDLTIDEKHEFLEGYGLSNEQLTQIAPVLRALNIINYATAVEVAEKAGNAEKLEALRTRLSGALDLYG